jgi:outer membrane protein assembly factor BamB
VFVFYGPSGAAAYSHSGELKWVASCGTESHFYGSGSSPVLYGNLVVVQAEREGHAVIALNKNTGEEVWRQSIGDSGFSTPALVDVEGRYELLCGFDQGRVCGLAPASGELLWECQVLDDFINPTAVAQQGIVFILGRGRSAAVRAGGRGDVTRSHIVWELPRGSYVPSAVLHAGHLYWSNEHRGVVYCAEAATGKMVYEKRLKPTPRDTFASPILADGKIYYVTREGGAYVLAAQPEFQQLAHNVIETDQSGFNASPAVSRGQILLRSNTHLYCIGLPLPSADAAQPAEGSGASAEPDDPS